MHKEEKGKLVVTVINGQKHIRLEVAILATFFVYSILLNISYEAEHRV